MSAVSLPLSLVTTPWFPPPCSDKKCQKHVSVISPGGPHYTFHEGISIRIALRLREHAASFQWVPGCSGRQIFSRGGKEVVYNPCANILFISSNTRKCREVSFRLNQTMIEYGHQKALEIPNKESMPEQCKPFFDALKDVLPLDLIFIAISYFQTPEHYVTDFVWKSLRATSQYFSSEHFSMEGGNCAQFVETALGRLYYDTTKHHSVYCHNKILKINPHYFSACNMLQEALFSIKALAFSSI